MGRDRCDDFEPSPVAAGLRACRAGGRVRAPAGQLLREPPRAGERVRGPRRRALHPRRGGDPDLPAARRSPTRRCSPASRPRSSASSCSPSTAGASRCAPPGRATIAHPQGQGGLRTTRVELPLTAAVEQARPRRAARRHVPRPRRLEGDRRRARARAPTSRSSVAGEGPHQRPADATPRTCSRARPTSATRASTRSPAPGTLTAPDGAQTFAGQARATAPTTGFTKVFGDAAAGEGVLLLLLLAAFGWGAVHALSPGHGKAMVAAYLVGTRGKPRHAVALGAMVTVTHTIGVFALGAITLALSQYVLPEQLYPVAEPGVRPARRRRRRRRAAQPAPRAPRTHHDTTTGTTTATVTATITGTATATSRRSPGCAACWRWARPRA